MRSCVMGPAPGGSAEPACAHLDNIGTYLPTAERSRSSCYHYRPGVGAMCLAFDYVAQRQVFRMARCGGRCGPESDMVRPLPAFAAEKVGNRHTWFHCSPVAPASSTPPSPSDGCFRKAPSLPYFPCSPSVTRFSACPAPCGTSMFCFGYAALPVWVSKQKSRQRTGEIFLRSLRRKHISALGAGHLASLRARVSRGQSGQIQTGEMTWHSTKTKSL